jgi:hypothetical protein
MTARRCFTVTNASSLAAAAAPATATPIITFLASSMCRSTHGMFADNDGGSIRHVAPLHTVTEVLLSRDSFCSVARKIESLSLLRASLMQVRTEGTSARRFDSHFHVLQLAPSPPLTTKEKSASTTQRPSDQLPFVDVLWQEEDGRAEQGSGRIYCATVERLVHRPVDTISHVCDFFR